jgi:nicotinate phosphoribosyltransferase
MRKPRPNLALLTDLYQLTMAYAYWKSGTYKKDAVFNLSFRKNPFGGGFAVACGLAQVVEVLENFAFDGSDLAYLAQLEGSDGKALFERDFLQYLSQLEFSCDVDAIPEGTVVFPHEPLVQVQSQLSKAKSWKQSSECNQFPDVDFKQPEFVGNSGEPVLEFGLRRAHGIDGALTASRAAYVGGCTSTSNVLAGKVYGIPVKGTHAHSWVMSFDTELEALQAYAEAMPNNCVLLVDTYDTLEGVKRAIEIGRWLRARSSDLAGIRLDSGDLAYLSIEARKLLDAAGFAKTVIVASNNLDEQIIASLKERGATINVWG